MGILIRFVVLLLLLLLPSRALAQGEPRERARQLANQAYEKYEAGHYAEANELFREAEELHHAPTLLLWIARSYEKLQKLVKAEATYVKLISEPLPKNASKEFLEARQNAIAERDAIASRVPHVQIGVPDPIPDDLRVILDGEPVERGALSEKVAVDPGRHLLVARYGKEEALRRELELFEGESMMVELPEPAREPDATDGVDWSIPVFVAAGVAGAGLLIGAIGGGVALSRKSELDERCVEGSCPLEDQGVHDGMVAAANASTAGFVIAGVGAAALSVFLALHLTGDEEEVAFSVSPTGAELEVRF
jgi:hypothetical protein